MKPQLRPTRETLVELASELGLDPAAAAAAIDEAKFDGHISKDAEGGMQSGVHGTPTFFLNGVLFQGPADYESLSEAIEAAEAGS